MRKTEACDLFYLNLNICRLDGQSCLEFGVSTLFLLILVLLVHFLYIKFDSTKFVVNHFIGKKRVDNTNCKTNLTVHVVILEFLHPKSV